jgi:putative DNA primase/helicase
VSLESDLRLAAVAFTGPAAIQLELNRIVDTPDVRAAYSPDFLKQCASLPADDFHWVKQTLRTKLSKEFDLTEWKRRIKEARVSLDRTSPLNGWHAHLLNSDHGPRPLVANAIAALRLAPAWAGVLAYDEFSERVVTRAPTPWQRKPGPWVDTDDIRLADWLQREGIHVSRALAREAVQVAAEDEPFHPVRDHLEALQPWDGENRLDTWLYDYMGVEVPGDPKRDAYIVNVGRMWLISAMARIFRPGCQVDTCLIFEGQQGLQKTQALRVIATPEWFTNHLSEVGNKDCLMELHGVWIVEIGDLHTYRKAERNAMRNFLTTQIDRFRRPWDARLVYMPRQNVFSATSNDDTWGTDPEEERRMWAVACAKRANISGLTEMRDQLLSEARARFLAGEPWWFPPGGEVEATAREEQRARFVEHPWTESIAKYLAMHLEIDAVTTSTLVASPIACPNARSTHADAIIAGNVLKGLGWAKVRHYQGKRGSTVYVRPEVER